MVVISKIAFALLCASVAHAASGSLQCPKGQQSLDNKVCCPGPLVMGDSGGDACCVPAEDCKPHCRVSDCKAKIDVDDPDYDDKLKNAMGGGGSDTSSASSLSSTAMLTTSTFSNSITSTATLSETSTSSSAAAAATTSSTDSGAAGQGPYLLIFGLSVLPVVWNSI